jgi:peptidoglycan hydrolase-like protein with peptidoglycan-binding domain
VRALAVVFAVLALAPAAQAACPVTVSTLRGPAPLRVSFRANCVSSSYRWQFGDGTIAQGESVTHTYPGGRFTPKLATNSGVRKLPALISVALRLVVPERADYGTRVTLRAQVTPRIPVRLGGQLFRNGTLALTVTQPLLTAVAGPVTVRETIVVRPRLDVRLDGSRALGSRLRVVAVLRPAHAGSVQPRPGWAAVSRVVQAHIQAPTLALGASGPAVAALERRLEELRFALRATDGVFGTDDLEAVLAFQKVNGLARTGVVTPGLWTLLARAGVPRARYAGDHVEVDKTRQVLFLVREGKVSLAVHVSTGATGNTPLGRWQVYSKVAGWSWVLWYPSYFLRGFAIHGYPEVPAYPASHGCVRIPMWLAPKLYTQMPLGSSVYVYT